MLFDAKIIRFASSTGVAIAIIQHHYCVGVYSLLRFISTLASFVRGESPELPLFNHSLFCGLPDQPSPGYHEALESVSLSMPTASTTTCVGAILRISAVKIADLKAAVTESLSMPTNADAVD